MNVCFNMGFDDRTNTKFTEVLEDKNDNNKYYVAMSVKDLLDMVKGQRLEFGRIFFSAQFLLNPQEDLTVLKRYFSQESPETEIIFVYKNDPKSKQCEKLFRSIMRGGNYIVIDSGSDSLSTNFLGALVCYDIRELKRTYGLEDDTPQVQGYDTSPGIEDVDIDEDLFVNDDNTDDDFNMGNLDNSYDDYGYDNSGDIDAYNNYSPESTNYRNNSQYSNSYDEDSYPDDNYDNQYNESDSDFMQKVCDIPKKKFLIYIGDESTEINKLATQLADNLGVEYNKRTLLVDLDCKHNYLLGDFNTNSFYEQGCDYGIKNQRPFVENEYIELLSNGYGTKVESSELNTLYDMGAYDPYDYVIFCCPIDGLSVLNAKLITKSEIRIIVKSTYQNMINALQCISDRDNISGPLEDLIYENSTVYLVHPMDFNQNSETQQFFEEDKEKINNNVVCTRYNWILGDNIEVVISDN